MYTQHQAVVSYRTVTDIAVKPKPYVVIGVTGTTKRRDFASSIESRGNFSLWSPERYFDRQERSQPETSNALIDVQRCGGYSSQKRLLRDQPGRVHATSETGSFRIGRFNNGI